MNLNASWSTKPHHLTLIIALLQCHKKYDSNIPVKLYGCFFFSRRRYLVNFDYLIKRQKCYYNRFTDPRVMFNAAADVNEPAIYINQTKTQARKYIMHKYNTYTCVCVCVCVWTDFDLTLQIFGSRNDHLALVNTD